MGSIRPPDTGVIIWVRVAETDPTLAAVYVACAIAPSTEVFIFTVSRCASLASSLANPGQDYPSLIHTIPTSS